MIRKSTENGGLKAKEHETGITQAQKRLSAFKEARRYVSIKYTKAVATLIKGDV